MQQEHGPDKRGREKTHLEHSPDQILGEIVKLEQGVCVLGRAGSREMLSQLYICQRLCSWPLLLPICMALNVSTGQSHDCVHRHDVS